MDKPQPVHDPAHIKALAHPIRLALLDYLGGVPHATATQCAQEIGESVASCSFHLRTLAKHGYIEQADAPDAKSKPWRIAPASRNQSFEPTTPAQALAVSALTGTMMSQVTSTLNEWVLAVPNLPQEAIDRATINRVTTWMTNEEHKEFTAALAKAIEPFLGRCEDPRKRPEGAIRTQMFLAVTPELAAYQTPEENES